MERFKILAIRSLTSKAGKPFEILQLRNEKSGAVGDVVNFNVGAFAVGDMVQFLMELNYRYQWTATLSKL